MTELFEINENIRILDLNSSEVSNQNIDVQDQFGEYKKHVADKLKNLQLMRKKETEKFNNLKITFLTLGKNTANMIPLAEENNNFFNLKTPPPEHTSNRKNAFKTPIVSSVNERDERKINNIRNKLSELFHLTENIVNSNLEKGEIVEKQQSLIQQILKYFNNGSVESVKLRKEFLSNQEVISETFLKIIIMKLNIAIDGKKLKEAEEVDGTEKMCGDLEELKKELLEEIQLLEIYRKIYLNFAIEIAKIPQAEDKIKSPSVINFSGLPSFRSPPSSPYQPPLKGTNANRK
ncbi:MAG: hypothetical protein H0U49_02765 [Parachlamydiaceae bacterium]|nr:hypothetical protein [Parachlamydiaceae bacterium]